MDRSRSADRVATGIEDLDDILAHYGIKGMKWGVRRSREDKIATKTAKLDAKFEKGAKSREVRLMVYNNAAKRMNSYEIPRINNKPKYRGKDLTEDPTLQDQYNKEVETAFVKSLRDTAQNLGTNASGTRRWTVKPDPKTGDWNIHTEAIRHADDETAPVTIKIERNELGFIISLKEAVLTHYGIKGMKWGVRREDPSVAPPRSEDSATAKSVKKKIKAGGLKSLSNEELKTYLERMDLEKRYKKGNPGPKEEATKFIKDTLLNVGKQEVGKFAAKQVARALAGR